MEEKVRNVPRRLVGCLGRGTSTAFGEVGEEGTGRRRRVGDKEQIEGI